MSLLDTLESPAALRRLSRDQLPEVVQAVRDRHIDVVAQLGGHFAASLGVAELTVGLHYVFDTPKDQIVWDTGHQAYIHKILTGRSNELSTIRQYGGLAPFCRRDESEYDSFGAGHAATSISAALGMAIGGDVLGEDFHSIAVIGDGAMTCGLAYEALNNAGHTDRNLIVILNDNDMSIAPAVGAMNKYLTTMITNPMYNRFRNEVKDLLQKAPTSLGGVMEAMAGKVEDSVKHLFVPGMIFEQLGFRYVGPVDGHDINSVVDTLEGVRKMKGPILVHMLTQKGKGFGLAEENPVKWHGASPFDKITGQGLKKSTALPRYQNVFGAGLVELGRKDKRVVAITAAMPGGTSTGMFADAFPDRFFDVGIAEAHGVTSAAGMATRGVKPVVAIYSTFLQRAYDSIVHDVALQNLGVIFCLDRAGIAGEDGPTHHGALDIAYMLPVPGMTITAPKDGAEMLALLRAAIEYEGGPWSIRWPRDSVPAEVPELDDIPGVEYGTWEVLKTGEDIAILAVGTMVLPAMEAARELVQKGISATVVNCRFLKPFDEAVLTDVITRHHRILTLEEGAVVNGFGAFISREITDRLSASDSTGLASTRVVKIRSLGIPDAFVEHGPRKQLLKDIGLDVDSVVEAATALVGDSVAAARESA